ncbi:MAG: hypothetical protein M1839_001017 [Geoglossum umbratile]|nr:MAG: hypothetical protein M1839_001017 [Geoglossum umbratile]
MASLNGIAAKSSPRYISLGQGGDREESRWNVDRNEVELSPPAGSFLSPGLASDGWGHDSDRDRLVLAPRTHPLERFTKRSLVNSLGPIIVVAFYLFIVLVYLCRPSINGVIQGYPIDAGAVFYGWSLLSVFVMDWARSGLAGVEAFALMTRKLAPHNALQLMWHADRGWGGPGGWWKAITLLYARSRHRFGRAPTSTRSRGPARLWYYLSLSSFLFFLAVPLAGLTMDRATALRYVSSKVSIVGVNETTFNSRASPFIWEQANTRWRQGRPTSPEGGGILYAPHGTKNASEQFYDDVVNAGNGTAGPISFFSGPQVSERAWGLAWGIQVNVSCANVNPYRGLKLLNVTSQGRWSYPRAKIDNENAVWLDNFTAVGLLKPISFRQSPFDRGFDTTILVASDRDLLDDSDYTGVGSPLPIKGTLEVVLWQAIQDPSMPDSVFDSIKSHPHVVVSRSNTTNSTSYGFGVTCDLSSTVGSAKLDARHHTFSGFKMLPSTANLGNPGLASSPVGNPGILPIQTLMLSALGNLGAIPGHPSPSCSDLQSATCSQWFGANLATGGIPILIWDNTGATTTRYPALSPERMQKAVYKLVGETAIAMMANGPGDWVGGLKGLAPVRDLVRGPVHWASVLVLLLLWMAITVIPTFFVITRPRWSSILDGFEMFKLGAEWKGAVHEIRDRNFQNCGSLAKVPGMIGDMDSKAPRGFIGLSKEVAVEKREYLYDRAQAQ